MKKFWNQHWKGIVIGVISAVVLTVVIHVILILCGFHFLYSPEQHNNWGAVSAVAAWVGIFVSSLLSVAAIWYAIQIPKKIADRQDRIALFEKRFAAYYELKKHFAFAKMLEGIDTYDKVLENAQTVFRFSFLDTAELFKYDDFHTTVFAQLPFLFPNINNDDCISLGNISGKYFVMGIAMNNNEKAKRMWYIHEVKQFFEKYDEVLRDYLVLYK